jgi:hypothetical protein
MAHTNAGKIEFKGTKEEERVKIAKDVLKWLDSGRLVAESGTYIGSDADVPIEKDSVDARKLLRQVKTCTVCARGAVLYGMLMRHDHLNVSRRADWDTSFVNALGDYAKRYDSKDYIQQLFSITMLDAMEDAFEGGWNDDYEDDRDRLEAIMHNIIRNDGEFVFSDVGTAASASAQPKR